MILYYYILLLLLYFILFYDSNDFDYKSNGNMFHFQTVFLRQRTYVLLYHNMSSVTAALLWFNIVN